MTGPTMRPMGVGEVLDRSFQVLRRHLGTLVVTALIGFAPILLLYALVGMPYGAPIPEESLSGGALMTTIVVFVLMMLGTIVVWAALTHQIDGAVSGGSVSVGGGLRKGVGAIFRLIGAGILIYLAFFGLMLPVVVVGALVGGILTATLGTGAVPMILTVVAFSVPAVIAMIVYTGLLFLIVPALIIEDLGPIRALRRANELAKGGRVRVFATAFMSWLVVLLPTFGIPFMLGMGMDLWDPQAAGEVTTTQLYLYQVLTFAVSALTTPFLAAAMVHSYYDRRARREGYDLQVGSAAMPATA